MVELVGAFVEAELLQQGADAVPDGGDGPLPSFAQQGFELG